MELLERFAKGDLDAFETLFRQFQGEVYRWIMRIVRDPTPAEDLTIETFWRIYRARARFDPTRSFQAWARRIASNLAASHLRNARAEVPLSENYPARPTADSAVQRELRDRIRSAFCSLPPKFQVAATLALIEERPSEEIADALGTSVGTVKSRVFRATRMLREKLERLGIKP